MATDISFAEFIRKGNLGKAAQIANAVLRSVSRENSLDLQVRPEIFSANLLNKIFIFISSPLSKDEAPGKRGILRRGEWSRTNLLAFQSKFKHFLFFLLLSSKYFHWIFSVPSTEFIRKQVFKTFVSNKWCFTTLIRLQTRTFNIWYAVF